MGINHYALTNVCPTCGTPERSWHIGKNYRTFRAYSYDGPLGHQIAEFQHWLPILRDDRITIRDEYGVVCDKEEFIADCKPRDISWEEHGHNFRRDVQGYVLYNGEFS